MLPENIRAAIQRLLDEAGDGWTVNQYVIAMGLERITAQGTLESTAWYWAPPEQPDWQTAGLLEQATEMQWTADMSLDDEDDD